MKNSGIWLLGAALCGAAGFAAEWHVDNVRGDDAAPGTRERPVRSFRRALTLLKGGDTLHVVPNAEPYREKFGEIGRRQSGTPEHPTVIDGHGATLTRMCPVPPERWTAEPENVWSMRYPNNVVTMSGKGYYHGFPFLFIDGVPATPVPSRAELAPGTCFLLLRWDAKLRKLDPLHKMLYLKLPAGKTPANTGIEAPECDSLVVSGDHVTVRNFRGRWSASDLFDTARGTGIVIENLRVSHCLDQCLSAHSTAGQDVRFSEFSRATAGGILDVTFTPRETCNTRYFGSIFHGNRMCGAGFRGANGSAELRDCILRDNDGSAVHASGGVKLRVENCYLRKGSGSAASGLEAWDRAEIDVVNSTIDGFEFAATVGGHGKIRFTNCRFVNCRKTVRNFGKPGEATVSGDGTGTGTGLEPGMSLETLRNFIEKSNPVSNGKSTGKEPRP